MNRDVVLSIDPLGVPWQTYDPFLFCVHHDDAYPAGNAAMGPNASLAGRNIGMDFEGKDGWRMYHGDVVPGFPRHPHRGFETVTILRQGFIDHSDSLGATARFGSGDVQWMTAGKGIVHSEMFPLLDQTGPNSTELFQIWLNLPGADKFVEPHFAMLWAEAIPERAVLDEAGRSTRVRLMAGELLGLSAPAPPPHSWAARAEASVAICTLLLAEGAQFSLPKAPAGVDRTLYFFRGRSLTIGNRSIPPRVAVRAVGNANLELVNGEGESELLLLQGRPIGEPVVQYGPFVMNTTAEIHEAMNDYRRDEYGGWPWAQNGPVHPRGKGRFAVHAGGRLDEPG